MNMPYKNAIYKFCSGFNVKILLVFAFLLVVGCDLFEYSPYQIVLADDEKNLTEKNLQKIYLQTPDDTVRIILMGDTQRFYDDVDDFVKKANTLENIDFVLHAGDISDFGLAQEFKWVHHIMRKLEVPYLTVVGNHDLITNGPKVYREMFGDFNYSMIYGGIKFIFVNTNSREYDFDGTVPDLNWLEAQLSGDDFDRAVIVAHIPPFDNDFDTEKELAFSGLLRNSGKVDLSLHGHLHSFSESEPYNDGITYFITTAQKKRGFALITLWEGGKRIERIEF